MKFERLGDITTNLDSRRIPLNSKQRIAKSKQGLYPYIGANNIVGYIDEYIFDEKILCVAEDGGSWGTNQTCAVMYEGKTWVNNHAHVLVENGKASLDFLRCYLNLTNLNKYIKGATRGKLNKGILENILIPLPSLSDQIQIATILSKAENLVSQRKESIRLLDEFLKSSFLEMFGDPVRNKKGFRKTKFGNYIIDIIAGSSYGGEQKETLNDDEFGVLKVSAVTLGVFNPKEFKVVNIKDLKGEIVNPKKGDLLFSRANTKELVGATCIVDKNYPKLFLPDKLWNIQLKEDELNKAFVHYLFRNKNFKTILTREASGTSGSMLNISMEKLRNVKFSIPPIELQTQFAQLVEKTEAIKTQYQHSLQELENLYGALSQQAFKGELTVKPIIVQ